MTNKFTEEVNLLVAESKRSAARFFCQKVTPEILLYTMLQDSDCIATRIVSGANLSLFKVRQDLEELIMRSSTPELEQLSTDDVICGEGVSNILRLAVLEARRLHDTDIESKHVLLAMLHDQVNNRARRFLEDAGIDYNVASLIMVTTGDIQDNFGFDEDDEDEDDDPMLSRSGNSGSGAQRNSVKSGESDTPVIDNFGTDLTQAAREGKLDPVVGREKEIQRLMEILCRRKKNNPALIGEPGVGKSAIVEGLAQLIVNHKVSPVLYGKRLVSMNMTSMVAGTKYRGQFEERMQALMGELEDHPEIIIFMDELHTLVGAGAASGTMDAANILKPALARGKVQCIGATTLDEYRNSIEKDGALERRFQKIIVEQTSKEDTLAILKNIRDRYEEHHNVQYTDDALEACVELTDRYVSDRYFPDKAIDVLDEAGSRLRLSTAQIPPEITEMEKEIAIINDKKTLAVQNQNYEMAASLRDRQTKMEGELQEMRRRWSRGEGTERKTVNAEAMAQVVASMTGIPVEQVTESENLKLRHMSSALKADVIGQDQAIDTVVKAIQRNRVGLHDHNRPIGAFMFLGPTGVGKTYLAKRLAELMFGSADALVRIDMSEYTEAFNASKLIGAPPGYVGYGEGGQLTERVRRRPYSIVLLDEIEKASSKIFNLMLQMLDEGRITDGNGRLVDFRHTIIIMTSNAGTRRLKEFQHGVGFNAGGFGTDMNDKDREYARSIIQKSLQKTFPPEFINRLDEIITFDQLSLESIQQIVDLEIKPLVRRVAEMGYTLTLTPEAKEYIARKGYDIQYGARPLKRALQTYVEDPVCESLLSGELQPGQSILLSLDNDKIKVNTNHNVQDV